MRRALILAALAATLGCASTPKQAVELSATVGRDVASVHKSHRQLVQLLFARMRRDVNRFVDDIYTPYQMKAVMDRQQELTTSERPEDRKISLPRALEVAFGPSGTPDMRSAAMTGMRLLLDGLRRDIEAMRRELLEPLARQETQVLTAVDTSYQQIHYANAIVTGHLASIMPVQDAQDVLLKQRDLQDTLGQQIGGTLATSAEAIGRVVEGDPRVPGQNGDVQQQAKTIQSAVQAIGAVDLDRTRTED